MNESSSPRTKRRAGRTPEQVGNAGHSPAPWKVAEKDQYSAVGSHWDVGAADGTRVCSVIGTGEQCRCEAETTANALLLIAAPELLAACKLALPQLVNEPAADAVRAAIAKAEGIL